VTVGGSNTKEGSTTTTPSLTIFSAAQSDAGTYTCFASNSVGTGQSTTTTLSVTESRLTSIFALHNGLSKGKFLNLEMTIKLPISLSKTGNISCHIVTSKKDMFVTNEMN
jgi:hypothetical protein